MASTIFDFLDNNQLKAQDQSTSSDTIFDAAITQNIEPNKEEKIIEAEQLGIPKEETSRDLAIRTTAREAKNILTDLPAEVWHGIKDFPKGAFKTAYERISGKEMTPDETKRLSNFFESLSGASQLLPTSERVQEKIKEKTGEYLQPQSKGEERFDEWVKDATTAIASKKAVAEGSIIKRIFSKTAHGLGIATAGQIGQQAAKEMGASEENQRKARGTSMLIASMIDPKSAVRHKEELYAKADLSLPKGASGKAKDLKNGLTNIINKYSKGSTPGKDSVVKQARSLLSDIEGETLPYRSAKELKVAVNTNAQNFYKESKVTTDKSFARRGFSEIHEQMDNFLKQAEKEYPEFYQNLRKADEVHGAISQSRRVSDFIKDNIKTLTASGIGGTMLALFKGGISLTPTIVGSAVTAGTGLKLAELVTRIVKSPTLRQHYLNVVSASAAQNLPQLQRNLFRLEKEIDEDKEIRDLMIDASEEQNQ